MHCFLMALALGILHGEMDRSSRYLSNQMPRTISTKPAYSIRFWDQRSLFPPERDVFARLRQEVTFRFRSERPERQADAILCDVRDISTQAPGYRSAVAAVVTSPPYFNVTSYEEDQWLRLWLLGGPPKVTYRQLSKDDRHENRARYWQFLADSWQAISPLLLPGAMIVCRIGGNGLSEHELAKGTVETLRAAFPGMRLLGAPRRSEIKGRQTDAFRPGSRGCRFELDVAVVT